MANPRWDDASCFLDPDSMGALPDACVPGASMADWQTVLDPIRTKGGEGRYAEGGSAPPVPRAETALPRPTDAECPESRVRPAADVPGILRLHSADEIDFDVDPRESRGREGLDPLHGLPRENGRRVGGPALLSPEGGARPPGARFRRAGRSVRPPRGATGSVSAV
ncbi:hypothetical protein, partial [Streptomyces sp. ST2-7A]|uniref:hypothetical protein n=1 Tax=Streptomyces sp. ST2-7A TaxID=2907214 RepID=UPI0027E222BA